MQIEIYPSYEQMSAAAAKVVADIIKSKPNMVLGLATGSTPVGLYKELIRMHKEEGLDFSKVTTFNLDEYIGLDVDHEQSYRSFMNNNLFNHINIDPANTHVPSGTAEDYDEYCIEYEDHIKQAGGIDIQVLGIGSDGHIGFNEPGTSLASRTHVTTLTRQTIKDNARFFENENDVPRYAITMGVGTINDARKTIILASGRNKAEAVAASVEGPVTSMWTASALQMHPDTTFFMDEEASANLKMKDFYLWTQNNKFGVS